MMVRQRALRASLGVLSMGLLVNSAGCDILGPDAWEERRSELEGHRDIWRAQQIQDYRFTFRFSASEYPGNYGEPFLLSVVVQNGAIESATFLESGTPLSEEHYDFVKTIDDIFSSIDNAIERRAHQFRAEYDKDLGYPTHFSVDYSRDYLDDEYGVNVSNLERF